MPLRKDLKSVLVIGSGPIVIGQAAEFDYSGTQALRVLKDAGIKVILINSNPATIMTDPDQSDCTYIEPITIEFVAKIIKRENPDALLPTLGGQTALNIAMSLNAKGVLKKYKVELIGISIKSIELCESRNKFKDIVRKCGANTPNSILIHTFDEAVQAVSKLDGYPLIARSSFTMGGLGSGIINNKKELNQIIKQGLKYSPNKEILLEESIIGWKEYELELMRDSNNNTIVVCSIENLDPVGIHTGDSITISPILTLTDKEYQNIRNIAIKIICEVNVSTGGCNIQFAINPQNGKVVVIEMNPRVSRSSALASKATGFAIAKVATKLSLGFNLNEIFNDITLTTPASFEPSLDYIVVKVPYFAFEKFPSADKTLTTTMKSVGEAMAIGRSFTESLQKALRSTEQDDSIFDFSDIRDNEIKKIMSSISKPNYKRLQSIQRALLYGISIETIYKKTKIDPWFLDQISYINEISKKIKSLNKINKDLLYLAKKNGFSDYQIGLLLGKSELEILNIRKKFNIHPVYKTVDTCAAEFKAYTPYHYSSYDQESEVRKHKKPSIIILGSGPNRIGQGIEFDYSCVHASIALKNEGYETVMVNCNPETVSTDYDISTRLYFEPLTLEDVLEVISIEKKQGDILGVFVQLGGQTPLKLAQSLSDFKIPILGTSPYSINLAEDRAKFNEILHTINLTAPRNSIVSSCSEARSVANTIGYPVLLRPSYVLGGRGMAIIYKDREFENLIKENKIQVNSSNPALLDKFLEDAIEIDVDALYDGKYFYLGGIMEHIEEAGIHSGDSACIIPPITLSKNVLHNIKIATREIAKAINVRGLINIQFALTNNIIYVLEANPRASRTVPFVSKATGAQMAKAAALIGIGKSIKELMQDKYNILPTNKHKKKYANLIAVKEAILPFHRFYTKEGNIVDTMLGPEMRSTGEVMGIDSSYEIAFAKSQIAANLSLPLKGNIFISVADKDKYNIVLYVKKMIQLNFSIITTCGTGRLLKANGIKTKIILKLSDVHDTKDNTIIDLINQNKIKMIINTLSNRQSRGDGYAIRAAATSFGIPCITTMAEFKIAVQAIEALRFKDLKVRKLQENF